MSEKLESKGSGAQGEWEGENIFEYVLVPFMFFGDLLASLF